MFQLINKTREMIMNQSSLLYLVDYYHLVMVMVVIEQIHKVLY